MIVMIGGGVGVVHYQQISLALLSAIHVPPSYTQDKQHCSLSIQRKETQIRKSGNPQGAVSPPR